jgi:DNA-binding transcriptional LysR family regulator
MNKKRINHFRIYQMRVLVALADGYRRDVIAKQNCVTPSSITLLVHRAEAWLEVELFKRGKGGRFNRGLTDDGKAVIDMFRRVLGAIDDGECYGR